MHSNDRFSFLLQQYLSGNSTVAEHDEFFELLATHRYDDLLQQAIQQDLSKGFDSSAADLPPHVAQEIIRNIFHAEKNTVEMLPPSPRRILPWRWIAAASVVLVVMASWLYLNYQKAPDASSLIAAMPANTIHDENTTAQPKIITLADGTAITLKPGSSIYYKKDFEDSLREVYLEGEAFFHVARNPQKPFLVYYNNLVTRVLGTSFTINTNPQTGNIEVAVKTGRVQVYENKKLASVTGAPLSVILTPNQKAVYEADKRILQASLVTAPELVLPNEGAGKLTDGDRFVYDQAKLSTVFEELGKAYGIEIVVENTNLNNCAFTGDLTSQDLFTKLKIICLTTNATYEITGTRILVKGVGCP